MHASDANIQSVAHEAMASRFCITLVHPDRRYARQAADAVFRELDQLERRLSRFVDGGDIFRVNRLADGASTTVHPDTFDCLRIAEQIRFDTDGRFDVAYASSAATPGPRFRLDAQSMAVRALVPGLHLDLGGIGKGFALDRMSALLADWEIDVALLAASSSTFLARGVPPGKEGWALKIGPDRQPQPLTLVGGAISASGTSVRGNHVVDPRNGKAGVKHQRVWAAAPAAAVADALSTAFLLMHEAAIGEYCNCHPRVSAWLLDRADGPLRRIAADGEAEATQ